MNTNKNSAHSFTEGSDSGTLKFSKPTPNFPKGGEEIKDGKFVSTVKEKTKQTFNEKLAIEIVARYTRAGRGLEIAKKAFVDGAVWSAQNSNADLLKENQELKAERDYWFYQAKNNTVNTELLEALEGVLFVTSRPNQDCQRIEDARQIAIQAINKAKS